VKTVALALQSLWLTLILSASTKQVPAGVWPERVRRIIMLGSLSSCLPLLAQAPVAQASAAPSSPPSLIWLSPVAILVLCVFAGIGTVLLLPGRRETSFRKIGGTLLAIMGLILIALLPQLAVGNGKPATAVYFWIFAAIAIVGAIRVVTHPRPVYSALYFVLTVFASAGLFILLEAEFMAAALVLIYAGAILVTYVFVIMLASQATSETATTPARQMAEYDNTSREPLAAAVIGFALMGVLLFVIFDKAAGLIGPAGPVPSVAGSTDAALTNAVQKAGVTQELGLFLFRNQLAQLELAGLLLTVAMVGAIMIARRQVLVPEAEQGAITGLEPEVVVGPATPIDDNPHSIPVYGTDNPRQKAYPQT
jgi:NADH-quinone oxidoreductase subunit J